MPTSNKHSQPDQSVLLTWKALLKEAQDKPWLAGLLARQGTQIFSRFVHFYHQLRSLPRRLRRALNARVRRRLATTLLGAALLLALHPPGQAQAATITVDGTCTLADAITAANNDAASGNCPAGSGPDTIDMQVDATLASALPAITSEITLEGNGYTIDGNGSLHVLEVNGGDLTLNHATITGGAADHHTSVSQLYRTGGGIYNYGGTVTINSSTISGNSAVYGGGIFNYAGATLTINNSTISNNHVTDVDGFGAMGGGIYDRATITINNSTITGNTASDGGGIYTAGIVDLNRNIISGNSASSGGDEVWLNDSFGTIIADNHNIIGYSSSARSNITPGASDIIPGGDIHSVLDTTLYDNGGPTLTHALVSGSPAIDLAPDADCATGTTIDGIDQRNYTRNVDGNGSSTSNECDAGAFEYGSEPTAITLSSLTAQAATASGSGLLTGLASLALGVCTAGYTLWTRTAARARQAVTEQLT